MKNRYTIRELMRENILNLVPYSSARSEFSQKADLFLDANENFKAFVADDYVNRYPDPHSVELKEKIEEVLGLAKERTVVGSGSDELIDLLFRIFCNPKKDKVLLLSPTYGAYEVFANINDVGVSYFQLRGDFSLDLNKMDSVCQMVNNATIENGMHKLLFICSPNNPSANTFSLEHIEMMIKNFNGITVVDEAYIDFSSGKSAVELLDKYEKLVVLRTFSKAWGLAGARVGVAVTSPEIVAILNKVKYPYNLSSVSQKLAIESLNNYVAVKENIALILKERQRVATALEKFHFVHKIFPSEANFLLVRVEDANKLTQLLRDRGVVIRNRSSIRGCFNSVRITIGSPLENDKLLEALDNLKKEL